MKRNDVIEKLSKLSMKMSENIYLQVLSQGIMSMLPIVIIGSFAGLFSGMPIESYQGFLQSSGIGNGLSMVVNATTNMLGVYFTYGMAKTYCEKLEIHTKSVPILVIVTYFTLLPMNTLGDGTAYLSYEYLGVKGMVMGILVSIFVVKAYKSIVDRKIVINMPEGTPSYVSNSFVALIPGFVIICLTIVVRLIFTLLPWKDAFNFIYSILQMPLTVLVGQNVWAIMILTMIASLIFALGVHSGFVTSLLAPLLFSLDGANIAAHAQGAEVPNILGMAFNYITTVAVFYPALAVATIIFAKSARMKSVGKIAVLPAFFGISEPLVFGLPIVFNPILAIPWVVVPALNLLIGYVLTSLGIVAKCIGVTVFSFPMIATGLLNGSVSIAIMEVGLFILDVLIIGVFIRLSDKVDSEVEVSV